MLFLLFLSLISLATAVPSTLTDAQKIQKIWGQKSELEIAIAEQILHEEGQRIGISGKDYLESCYAETEKLVYTDDEWAIQKRDQETAAKLKGTIKQIESKDDVIKTCEKHIPEYTAIFMKRVNIIMEFVKGMDADSQKFVNETTDALLEMVVTMTKPEFKELKTPMAQYSFMAKDFVKIFDAYLALPQPSKNALERAFCSRVSLRIVFKDGEWKEFIKLMYHLAKEEPVIE